MAHNFHYVIVKQPLIQDHITLLFPNVDRLYLGNLFIKIYCLCLQTLTFLDDFLDVSNTCLHRANSVPKSFWFAVTRPKVLIFFVKGHILTKKKDKKKRQKNVANFLILKFPLAY